MNKINNKNAIYIIVFGLGILAFLILEVITMPLVASADRPSYVTPYGSTTYSEPAPIRNSAPAENPKPVIASINPKSSNVGVGTKTITITGEGFIPSSIGRINNSNRLTTFIDSSHLLMQITGNDTYAYRSNGGFFVTVFNGAPGGGYSNAAFFAVNKTLASAPTTASAVDDTTSNFTDLTQTENADSAENNNSSLASNAIFGSNSFLPSSLIQWVFFAIIVLLLVILVRRIFGANAKYHATPLKHD